MSRHTQKAVHGVWGQSEGGIWKETAADELWCRLIICLDELRKITKSQLRIAAMWNPNLWDV
jgi:hypothetical protein